MSNLVSYLFKTNAFKVCPENKPFWYTSGKIGPYFINTHFLYGSEEASVEFLKFIDVEKDNKLEIPKKILDKCLLQYNSNTIYKEVVDEMVAFVKEHINIDEIDYVSGGERRDWFFSNMVAHLLDKPHISIYKDLSTVISNSNFEKTVTIDKLEGAKVLHVADLVTVASSYVKYWNPAIKNLGATMNWSSVVVDRMQGGEETLKKEGIEPLSLIKIDNDLFKKAYELGRIDESQLNLLNDYREDPYNTMRNFLINNPTYLENILNGDNEKAKKRAKILVDNNLYKLPNLRKKELDEEER